MTGVQTCALPISRGRVIEIYGPESSGKTTVALHAVAEAQKQGGIAALIGEFFGLDQTLQIVLFTIISIVCIFVTRPLAKKYLRGNTIKTNLDRVIGKHCLVTETITADNKGEVKVMGTLWMATSLNNMTIQAGEYAEIVSIEGAHVIVKKINRESGDDGL